MKCSKHHLKQHAKKQLLISYHVQLILCIFYTNLEAFHMIFRLMTKVKKKFEHEHLFQKNTIMLNLLFKKLYYFS